MNKMAIVRVLDGMPLRDQAMIAVIATRPKSERDEIVAVIFEKMMRDMGHPPVPRSPITTPFLGHLASRLGAT